MENWRAKLIFKQFSTDKIDKYDLQGVTHLKIEIPAEAYKEVEMYRKGYFLADRTIGVTVSLNKLDIALDKLIRLPIIESSEFKNEILKIAQESFPYDRRFHLTPECNNEIACAELHNWVSDLGSVLICIFKENPIGFLALKEIDEDILFVHLAAVEAKYRLAGAAMSLYARAIQLAKERGYKKLNGRISTMNVDVMNLYSYFGAKFENPIDIFLKEVQNES